MELTNQLCSTAVGFRSRLDMKEAVMTDPRNYDYVRSGEALSYASLWTLGIGTAVVIALLVIVSYIS